MRQTLLALTILATAANAAPVRTMPAVQLPYTFELNQGQTDPSVRYLARGKGYTLFLTDREAVMKLQRSASSEVLRMSLAGGRAPRQVDALDREGSSNYFIGDAHQWKSDVPRFARVLYRGVYPGIDILYHSQEGQLEYDFVVAPGAAPSTIAVRFDGAKQIRVNRAGDLELAMAGGTLVHRRPVAWQDVAGARRPVEANYVVRDGAVGFRLGAYDRSLPLVIDPVVVYSTYIGGNTVDMVNAVAVDKEGNTYLTGETTSIDFPTAGAAFTKMQFALTYGFIMKLNPAGNKIVYSSYIGGSSSTRGLAIAVDGDGNAYLGGVTGARDFPLANATQTTQPSLNIGFVTKLNAAGDKLLFSTYLGGERNDRVDALAIDAQGSIYVTGYASSTTLPVVNAFQSKIGGSNDALVAKFAAPNYRIAYCSYLGGTGEDNPFGIAVDGAGAAYVAGYTWSPNLATPGVFQTKMLSSGDGFLARIQPGGQLGFYTYLGGANEDHPQAIALDAAGNPVITGSTNSKNYPITDNAIQKELKGYVDAFVTKMDANGAKVLYSTYLGGTQATGTQYLEEGRAIAIDRQGNIVVAGVTNSADFPSVRPVQHYGGSTDAFLTVLNAAGDRILYSTAIGGSKEDIGHGIAVDPSGAVYVSGHTQSADYPMKGALRSAFGGSQEGFLTKICDPALLLSSTSLSFVTSPSQLTGTQNVTVNACTAIPFTATSTGAFLSLTPGSGSTNATLAAKVDATGMTPGDYHGAITVTAPDAINSPVTIDVVLHVAPLPPVISAAGVVNAASAKGGAVAPGELITIYGTGVGPDQLAGTTVAQDGSTVMTETGFTRVLFDGVPSPMIYASAGQTSAIVPYSVQGKTSTKVEVERYGVRSTAVTMQVTPAVPALFTLNSAGFGPGAIVNQDGSVNTDANAAERGSVVVLYGTGEGQTDPGGVDGLLALKAWPKPMQPVRVTIGGQQAEVLYAGAAPGMVAGVMQINVKVPAGVTPGNATVVVGVGSANSPETVTVAVK